MSSWLTSWPVFGVVGLVFAAAMWKILRDRAPLKCPSCRAEPEWTGSGTKLEPPVDYRVYKCRCGERLVKESDGPLQRFDDWVPGRTPQPPTKARIER